MGYLFDDDNGFDNWNNYNVSIPFFNLLSLAKLKKLDRYQIQM